MRNRKILFVALDIMIACVSIYMLFFTSFFWLGTLQQHHERIEASNTSYFAGRFLFNLLIVLPAAGLMMLSTLMLDPSLRKSRFARMVVFLGSLALLIASATMIFLSMQ